MRRIIDWILSIIGVLVIGGVLTFFDPILKIAARIGRRHEEREASRLCRRCIDVFRICGTKLIVEHNDGMVPGEGYIIISNHQSMADIPLLTGQLPHNTPAFVSKSELGKWVPSVSYHLRYSDSALIDRDNPRQALRAIRDAAEAVQERNGTIVIFPEGTRTRDGELREFQAPGSVILLRHAPDLPVVPATIDGSWDLLTVDKVIPAHFGGTIRLRFGDPIPRSSDEDHREIVARARAIIDATLTEWRAET